MHVGVRESGVDLEQYQALGLEPACAYAASLNVPTHQVESHQAPTEPQQAEQPKNVFEAAFEAISKLFAPAPADQKGAKPPPFDLGKILTDILGAIFKPPQAKAPESCAAQPQAASPDTPAPDESAINLPNASGEVQSQDMSIKIVPTGDEGVKGIKGDGQVDLAGSADLGAGTRANGSFKAETFAGAKATGGVTMGPNGLVMRGEVGAAIGLRASAEGGVAGPWGNVSGGVSAELQAYIKAAGQITVNQKGLEAQGTVAAGVLAGAKAHAEANVAKGLVKAEAKGQAQSGAGADAKAKVTASFNPASMVFQGDAGAFAGARAGFEAEGSIAGFGYKVSGQAWAGVGAKAQADVGLKDGKFSFKLGVGIALGVGAFLECGFTIDTKDIGSIVVGVIGAAGAVLGTVGQAVGSILKPVGEALGAVAKPLTDFLGGLFKAIGSLFGGGKGNGDVAKDTVKIAAEQAQTPAGLGAPLAMSTQAIEAPQAEAVA